MWLIPSLTGASHKMSIMREASPDQTTLFKTAQRYLHLPASFLFLLFLIITYHHLTYILLLIICLSQKNISHRRAGTPRSLKKPHTHNKHSINIDCMWTYSVIKWIIQVDVSVLGLLKEKGFKEREISRYARKGKRERKAADNVIYLRGRDEEK